jgi:hypothetical protein
MKKATELLDEILRYVRPPRGCAITLTEVLDGEPNWDAGTELMPDDALGRFNTKIAAFRKSEPRVDWSDVTEREDGRRRVSKWFSELKA